MQQLSVSEKFALFVGVIIISAFMGTILLRFEEPYWEIPTNQAIINPTEIMENTETIETTKIIEMNENEITTDVSTPDTQDSTKSTISGKININTASISELDTLPNIGEKTAQKIIAYRESSAGFSTIEDIMKVSGIGIKKFEQLKDYITVK